jgi:hypothetical protein
MVSMFVGLITIDNLQHQINFAMVKIEKEIQTCFSGCRFVGKGDL